MFSQKGVITIPGDGIDEEKMMEDCFDAGAEDFSIEDGIVEIVTAPADFSAVRLALEEKGYQIDSAEVEYIPSTYTTLDDEEDVYKRQEIKSGTYRLVMSATYFVCFFLMQVRMPTMLFGIMCIVFCILYSIVACILIYRFAPKTFRLRA